MSRSASTSSNTANSNCDDIEYFPRRKRAPYLHDISDFGILRTHHGGSLQAGDDLTADNMSTLGGLASSAGSSSSLSLLRSSPTKLSAYSGESGGTTSQPPRRRSSFARVFSTLRMTIAEDGGGDGTTSGAGTATDFNAHSNNSGGVTMSMNTAAGGGTLGDGSGADDGGGNNSSRHHNFDDTTSDSNLNSILPTRFRRGSSADFMNFSGRGSISGRHGTAANTATAGKIPRWALYGPATIVIKDGMPISMGTLLHHYSLLNNSQSHQALHNNNSQSSLPYLVTPTWRFIPHCSL